MVTLHNTHLRIYHDWKKQKPRARSQKMKNYEHTQKKPLPWAPPYAWNGAQETQKKKWAVSWVIWGMSPSKFLWNVRCYRIHLKSVVTLAQRVGNLPHKTELKLYFELEAKCCKGLLMTFGTPEWNDSLLAMGFLRETRGRCPYYMFCAKMYVLKYRQTFAKNQHLYRTDIMLRWFSHRVDLYCIS
jgi:hypothetical protein